MGWPGLRRHYVASRGKGTNVSEAAVAGKEEKDVKDGNPSVDTPTGLLPAPSYDDKETGQGRGTSDDSDEEDEEDDGMVTQRLWSDTPSRSSRLLSGSDILSDALDFAGVPVDTPSGPQQTTSTALAMTGVGRDITVDEVQNVEVDAKEMEAFLTSLEALLTSSSKSPTCSSMETVMFSFFFPYLQCPSRGLNSVTTNVRTGKFPYREKAPSGLST